LSFIKSLGNIVLFGAGAYLFTAYGLPLITKTTGGGSSVIAAEVTGSMSVASDFCTFSSGAKDYCWIPEGSFQITNKSRSRLDEVVLQIDFFNCDGVAEASQNSSTCKAAARVHMVCENMYIDAGTKAGCTAKSYERGNRPWNEDWIWTVRAIS
jgi:hypothetical protein